MANIVNFTDKQFENRLNDNLEELVQGKKAVESLTAFLLGGQPGSGKTSLRSEIFEETQGNIVVIDNETFKQQHPKLLLLSIIKVKKEERESGSVAKFSDKSILV